MPDLQRLNRLPDSQAQREFMKCCGSARWAVGMAGARPFEDFGSMVETAETLWFSLDERDWLEAFAHHPQIGDRRNLAERFPDTGAFSKREQAGLQSAGSDILDALADANRRYLEKNGFIFLVCASGKSASQMLDMLRTRLKNERSAELKIAAREQMKIAALRMEKLS